jgi:hypothetical protein
LVRHDIFLPKPRDQAVGESARLIKNLRAKIGQLAMESDLLSVVFGHGNQVPTTRSTCAR